MMHILRNVNVFLFNILYEPDLLVIFLKVLDFGCFFLNSFSAQSLYPTISEEYLFDC